MNWSRICVGRHVANQNLFIQLASMLWACNFQPDKDSYGAPIIPDVHDCLIDMTMQVFLARISVVVADPNFYRKCKPFSCDISPRFAEVSEILEESIKANHYGQL